MSATMARYRVKPEYAEENAELERAISADLELAEPEGIKYRSFRLEDGVTFVHIAIESGEGPSPLSRTAAFHAFRERLHKRCAVQPVVTDLSEISAYRF